MGHSYANNSILTRSVTTLSSCWHSFINMICSYVILVFLLMVEGRADAGAEDHLLTSSYSQVSRSGSARSHAGQTPWTHSSDAQIIRGQNLVRNKPNLRISVMKKKDKLAHFEDGTGEIIQERFNPRPWFAYEAAGKPKPNDLDVTVPFDSFPLPLTNKGKPSTLLKPPFDMNNNDKPPASSNTFGSLYSSYNTNSGTGSEVEPVPDKEQSTKPPSNFVTSNNEYLPPSESDPDLDHSDSNDSDLSLSSVPYKYSPGDTYDHQYQHHQDSPGVPYKYSPDDTDNHQHYHAQNYPSEPYNYSSEDSSDTRLPTYLEHSPHVHGYSHHFHHDHPSIYYEVKTTTEVPENQRLNKRPYSYYYIGRKLWYIPLYFSVYFIIYIFLLILKSIARHKITFNQYFEDDKRELKGMHEEHEEYVHELEHHVFHDIMNAKRKYIM